MQVVRDIGYIKDQQRRGRRFTLLGMIALALAFAAIFQQQNRPELILVTYIAMTFGFIFFNIGLQTVTKFTANSRKLRNDQQLDKALARLNDRHTLIHYPALGQRRPEHLLVHNGGVLVLTVRELAGEMEVKGRKWRRKGSVLLRLFNYSGPQLGNPTADNEREVATVAAYLVEHDLPDAVDGAIVFTHPTVTVRVTDSPVDVVDADGLPDYVRALGEECPPLTTKERLALVEALSRGEELEQASLRGERRRRAA
jgi:hypothetical protein